MIDSDRSYKNTYPFCCFLILESNFYIFSILKMAKDFIILLKI